MIIYMPIIFYGRSFEITQMRFVTGWRMLCVATGFKPPHRRVIFGSIVLRANKHEYTERELVGMSWFGRLIHAGWWC